MSPIAVESGKRQHAVFCRACDKRLRVAICVLADATRHSNPWAQDVYTRARARGQNHQRAIRTLGRARTRIPWTRWTTNTPYDPARHHALQQLLPTKG